MVSFTFGRRFEAGLRQRHLAGSPRQELHAEILFELADPVAEGRLRQVEMRRRELEAAALGNGDEGMKAEKVDAHGVHSFEGSRGPVGLGYMKYIH